MDAWKSSPIYRLWVIGGLIAIVAFAVIGGLSDPTDQSLIFWLLPMLPVYMGLIFFSARAARASLSSCFRPSAWS